MKNFKTSIIIPTYKENKNIKILIPLIYKFLANKNIIFEIIIVDDNSNDGIVNTCNILKKKFKNLKLFVRKDKFKDLSLSCFIGFELSKYETILVMDADLQHNPKYLKILITRFHKEKLDVLVACRNFKIKSQVQVDYLRFYLSKIIIFLFNNLLDFKTKDPMSGFFIFKKKIYQKNKKQLFGKGYKILADILYNSKCNLIIKDYSIKFGKRYKEKSKINLNILLLIILFLIKNFIKKMY